MIVHRKFDSPAIAALAGSALLSLAGVTSGFAQAPQTAPVQTRVAVPAKRGASPSAAAPKASPIKVSAPPVTLSRPTTPEKAPSADGFIQRWLILEPIKSAGLTQSIVQTAVKKEMFPNQFTGIPKDGEKVTLSDPPLIPAPPRPPAPSAEALKSAAGEVVNKEAPSPDPVLAWHAVDTKNYNVNLYHFSTGLGKETSNVMFWAVTVINAPQEMKDMRLAIGSNAASVWWVNGEEVIDIYGDRQTVVDDGISKRLTLKKGPNLIRAVIVNAGGATDFCARFLDANDKPIKNITASLQ